MVLGKSGGDDVGCELFGMHRRGRDFFLADLLGFALKGDATRMEIPIFSLSTKKDLSIWKWESQDRRRRLTVTPSVAGRATQYDKDILIYVGSQLTAGLDRSLPDAQNRTVRFKAYDYLMATDRGVSGAEYAAMKLSLTRLQGTNVTTNIATGGRQIDEGFGLIDRWRIVTSEQDPARMGAVEVTLSQWLYNAFQAFEVRTISDCANLWSGGCTNWRVSIVVIKRWRESDWTCCGRRPAAERGGLAHSDSLLRFLSGTSEAIMLPI